MIRPKQRKSDFNSQANAVLEGRRAHGGPLKTVSNVILILVLPIIAVTLIQYFRYGFALFLGWDTSTYVWWTSLVYLRGPLSLVLQGYPNLYILGLAAFGALIGSVGLAERILPILVAMPLALAYYSLAHRITSNQSLGYFAALLGGLSVNTLRLYADLHRNFLSYSLSMAAGTLIASQFQSTQFEWRPHWKRALVVWLPILAVAAYTQIETYAVLSLTLLLLFASTRRASTTLLGLLFLAAPVLAALPLMWTFLFNYQAGLTLLGQPPLPLVVVLGIASLFLGGLALPWVAGGAVVVVRHAQRGSASSRFVALWLLSLILLAPIGFVFGLPVLRLLYAVPVPVLIASGIPGSIRYMSKFARIGTLIRFPVTRIRTRGVKRYTVRSGMLGLVLTATLLTSLAGTDLFLQPYVSPDDINLLVRAADLIRQSGYQKPILVMYGENPATFNSIYRAYFGIEIPESLAYYGKLQYVFTMPSPTQVYKWRYNPEVEQASYVKYSIEILNQLGGISAIAAYPIVVAGGKTYDHPLAESFIAPFQRLPGIYIIPPGQLTPEQIDTWRLYASTDWISATSTTKANATWSESPTILNWVAKENRTVFQANFTISLARAWSAMELKLRFYDWPQQFVFPDSSTVALSPLEVYFDDTLTLFHGYGGQGPATINATLTGVSSGVHHIRIKSWAPGLGVAIALDNIQVCPFTCSS